VSARVREKKPER